MNYISYIRVSTVKQGVSGLGLEAQQLAVRKYIGHKNLVAEYIEIESGNNNNRGELIKALEHCKQIGSTLIIAKLDRLSRNLSFISNLMDSGIKFVACDLPEANEFTIHIFAALAQQERKYISTRTKEALAARSARGCKNGNPQFLTDAGRKKAHEANRLKAAESINNRQIQFIIKNQLSQPKKPTLQAIADTLNELGFKTTRGRKFYPSTVKMYIGRLEAVPT